MVAYWLMEEIQNIVFLHAATLLISVFLTGLWYTRTEKNDLLYAYCALQACLMLWLLGKLVKVVAPYLWLRWAGIVTQYLGMCFLGPALLAFAYRYCRGFMPPRWIMHACGGVSTALFVLCATNPLHHLLYTVFTMIRDSFGILNPILTVYTFALAGASCALILATFRRRDARGRRSRLLFLASIIVPWAAYFYAPLIKNPADGWNIDVTPIFFGFSFLLLGGAVFRFGMLDLVRCAFNQVTEDLNDGLILADRRGRVRYANSTIAGLMQSLAPALPTIGDDEKPFPAAGGFTHAYARPLLDGQGRRRGTVFRFVDRSKMLALGERYARHCRELERANRDLADRIRDRHAELLERHADRLASELHDVIGHSLTLAIALLDGAAAAPQEGTRAVDRFARAGRIIRDGMAELDDALGGAPGDASGRLRLSEMLRALPEFERDMAVEVDLQVRGVEEPVSSRKAEQVQRVCAECLANSIRHGRATRVQVILGYRASGVEVDIRDNGSGCGDIRQGNGLRDIAERIRDIDGSVRFSSEPDRGFHTRLWFPAA
jgi:signal transduction histidine kinase